MTFDAPLTAKGLAARLADVEATVERFSSFAFRAVDPPPSAIDAGAAARDFVLRAFAAMADPINDRLLQRLAQHDATLDDLGAVSGLPRLAVWERVNDLVQVGIVAHVLDGDRAGLTGAGQALVELIDDLATRVAEHGDKR